MGSENTKVDYFDAQQLAAHILGVPDDAEEWDDDIEEKLLNTYGISTEEFCNLITALAPLCEVGVSPITKAAFRGFANRQDSCWLVKVNA